MEDLRIDEITKRKKKKVIGKMWVQRSLARESKEKSFGNTDTYGRSKEHKRVVGGR